LVEIEIDCGSPILSNTMQKLHYPPELGLSFQLVQEFISFCTTIFPSQNDEKRVHLDVWEMLRAAIARRPGSIMNIDNLKDLSVLLSDLQRARISPSKKRHNGGPPLPHSRRLEADHREVVLRMTT